MKRRAKTIPSLVAVVLVLGQIFYVSDFALADMPLLVTPPGSDMPQQSLDENNPPQNETNLGNLTETQNFFMGSVLSAASGDAVPYYPSVKAEGYSQTGRSGPYVGFVTLTAQDRNQFSYRYDLGGAAGATVDVTLQKEGRLMDLSEGFWMDIRRQNKVAGFDGLSQVHVLFTDANENTLQRDVALSDQMTEVTLDLTETGFDAANVSKIVLRQTYADVDGVDLQEERRGEIFIGLPGAAPPVIQTGEPLPQGETPFKPFPHSFEGAGSNRNNGTIPGFITPFETGDGFAFRYDVGGTADSQVAAALKSGISPIAFTDGMARLAIKNSGNGAMVKVRFLNQNGAHADYTLQLTGTSQLFEFDLTDEFFQSVGFDPNAINEFQILVDRGLSPERRGRIDFELLQGQDGGEDPFLTLKPMVDEVTTDETGKDHIAFTGVSGAAAYDIQIATDPNFTNILNEGVTVVSPVSVKLLPADGVFYIRVRGIKEFPVGSSPRSLWSETFVYDKGSAKFHIVPNASLGGNDITVFPNGLDGPAQVTSIGAGGDTSDFADATERGVEVTFDTGSDGFAGGGFTFDDFGRPEENGFADLSRLSDLVFGIRGDVSEVKFEVVDTEGNSASVQLDGIDPNIEKFWKIPTSKLAGVDLTKVRIIYFIAEGGGKSGKLFVNRVRTNLAVTSAEGLTFEDATPLPDGENGKVEMTVIGGGTEAFGQITESVRGMKLTYDTGTQGWIAGGFRYGSQLTGDFVSGSLDGLTHLVFGIKGDHDSVKLEVSDEGAVNRVVIPFSGISSTEEKFFRVPVSYLSSLDLDGLISFFFVVEGTDLAGELTVNHLNAPNFISYDPTLTKDDIVNVPGDPELFAFPAGVTAGFTGRGIEVLYDTFAQGFGGAGFTYDDFGTEPFEFKDFSGVSELVLGIEGDSDVLKLELEDAEGKKKSLKLINISSAEERIYKINLSYFSGLDMSRLRLINFIVEGASAGSFRVNRFAEEPAEPGLVPDVSLDASDITIFPEGDAGALRAAAIAPDGAASTAALENRGVRVTYDTGNAGWAGGGFSYDDFGDATIQDGDLRELDALTFGIQGDASRVKLEVIDETGNKASVYLKDISPAAEQIWRIPLSSFSGVDLNIVRLFYFIVEGDQQSGSLLINHIPSNLPLQSEPSKTTDDLTEIPASPDGKPAILTVKPNGDSAAAFTADPHGLVFSYDTGSGGWAGIGYNYETGEAGNLNEGSLDSLSELVFGLQGDVSVVTVEATDAAGRRIKIKLSGISPSEEKFFAVPVSLFDALDITRIKNILFIVEGPDIDGQLTIHTMPRPAFILPDTSIELYELPGLPGTPFTTAVSPGTNGASSADTATARGVSLAINTGQAGWSGGGFSYDNFGTQPIEFLDVSGAGELVFGMQRTGLRDRVKLELVDTNGISQSIQLRGISTSEEKIWHVPLSLFDEVDLTHLRLIYFIVEGDAQQGTLIVNHKPADPVLLPSQTLTPQDIIPFTNYESGTHQVIGVSPDGASANVSPLPRGANLDYSTGNAGWSAIDIVFDNFGTGGVTETGDLSSATEFHFGIKGDVPDLKMEVKDIHGNVKILRIKQILAAQEQVYVVPVLLLDGIDLTQITEIVFVVEGNNLSGSIELYRDPA